MESLVQLAHALADETRLRILTFLLSGEATLHDVVTRLHLPQSWAANQLALLRQAGLVSLNTAGRQRVYRTDVARVQTLLKALQALAPAPPPRRAKATREVRRNTALRQARTCYDHLAGVVGIQLLDEMLRRAWIRIDDEEPGPHRHYRLTPQGIHALGVRGINVARATRARRQFAYGCLDWVEGGMHLGGALGAEILEALLAVGVVRQQRQGRTIVLPKPLTEWFEDFPSGPVVGP
jgi:DNA-binding transcriptional ArsR family regulator